MNNLTNFIRIVLSQSKLAMEKGEIPIASVIVDPIDERIIARSFNQEIASNDPTAHAEILCIRKACKKLNQKIRWSHNDILFRTMSYVQRGYKIFKVI